MRTQCLGRYALGSCIAAAMLAGCGGSQPLTGAPGAIAQSSRIATHADRGRSWMLPEAKSEVLLYATGGCLGTCVFSYPNGKIVGSVITAGQSICTDVNGDVFITQSDQVVEYAHGATSPVATLSLPGLDAWGCSVDTTTGNLAVVFSGSTGNIAIFTGARGNPNIYGAKVEASYCGYDSAGNLFVDGWGSSESVALSELPARTSGFDKLSIDQHVGVPGQIQWDGSYMTWQSSNPQGADTISRFVTNGSQATIVGTTNLEGIKLQTHQSWIYNDSVIVPFAHPGARRAKSNEIGIWSYPKGGKATKLIRNFGTYNRHKVRLQGVAISVAPSH